MAAPLAVLARLGSVASNVVGGVSRGGKTRLVRTSNNIDKRFKQIQRFVQILPSNAHKFFRKTTPIDTGNARNKTKLENTTISANYNYANRLNEGYSRQARKGMTQPTIAYIRRELRKLR